MGQMTITPEALALSGHKFRKELLQMPVHAMQETVQHMTVRRGIRYAETVGEITGNIDLGPYSETRIDNDEHQGTHALHLPWQRGQEVLA